MMIRYPKYFTHFSCIASDCPDSCCKEWEVAVDEASAAYYKSLPGQLGDRLRQVIREEDGLYLMTIENGRCPMWRQDGLCTIQAQHGHQALCQTCRDFPRLKHEYEGFTEQDLELSCPEAARLIFFGDTATVSQGQPEPIDDEILDILLQSRIGIPCTIAEDPASCVAYGCGKSLGWITRMTEGPANLARKRLMRD